MDYFGILKRALKITWHHRALWVFGILLAFTGGGGFGGGFRGYTFGGGQMPGGRPLPGSWGELGQFLPPRFLSGGFPVPPVGIIIGVIILMIIVALLLAIVQAILRYVSDNALIQMVNRVEETGEAGTVGQGFRMGWSRPAWRMFLIDLVVGVPFALIAITLVLIGLSPLLLLSVRAAGVKAMAIILTVGAMLLVIGFLILVGIAVGVLIRVAHREAALSGRGVFEAIREGYKLIVRNLSDFGLIWLLMLGVGIAWGIIMIPVFLLVLVLAVAVGGAPAGLIYLITRSALPAVLVGVPLGLLTLILPLVFLGGLYETFASAVWTLTFREILAKESGLAQAAVLPPAEATEAS